ncbi:MAG TPA: hypothetical protein VKT52_11085, partial [Ktedonobacterales bacterium]|nr:hypothetical protein [Ktedonobacterales bacterium]
MMTEHDTSDEAIFEADTAELKAAHAAPSTPTPSGGASESMDSAPTPAEGVKNGAGDTGDTAASQAVPAEMPRLAPGASIDGYR